MRRHRVFLLAVILGGLAGGCTMIPKYERPGPPVPPTWPSTATAEGGPGAAPDIGWREFFTDSSLQAVIEMALANNRDLRVADLNIEKVRALYRIQRSGIYPQAGVLASVERTRLPGSVTESGTAQTGTQYSVQAGVSAWELDLFGRIRSLKKGALEQFLATEQARSATRISIVAAVAQQYLALAADLDNLNLTRATFDARKAYYELIRKSRDLGVASDLDVREAESEMESSRMDAARYAGLVETDRNALSLLAGAPVPEDLLPEGLEKVAEPKEVSAGLSSEALLRRPDILAAEHQLIAANANIGAARAAFFPTISLTAAGGTLSPDLSGLFGAGTGTWTFAPQILAPIFTGGRLKANLKSAKVDRQIAVALYEQAIQTGFREVADALALRTSLSAQLEAARSLVGALEEAYRLSRTRYEAGVDSFLTVLVAERSLYAAREGLVGLRMAELANRVTLYKALGGGL
jgi:multidrug efflux system outer membrane protein